MKRILLFLLALSLLCMGSCALAEQSISLEVVNEARLPLHEAEDPYIQLLRGAETAPTDGLPVLILPVKKNLQINTRILPQSVRNKKVTMEVDNADIVRVKGNSLTGLAAGETVLTIVSQADESVKLQYRVLVIQQVSRISLTAAAKSVAVGDTLDVTAAFQPENATLRQVTWTSGDERIATVDENGRVTGVKRGNVRIIATSADGSNIRSNISVQVTQPAGEISLDKTEITVDAGRNTMIRATVLPKDANDKNVIWSTSDPSIATVNAQGRITGARPVYDEDVTLTVAKSLTEIQDGDTLEFLCDYYTYDGDYQDSYLLGEPMTVSGDLVLSNVDVGEGKVLMTYRFTDIYQQHYWTESLVF